MSLRRAAVMSEGDENGDHHHPERVALGQGTLGRAALERRAQLVHGSGSAWRRPRALDDLRTDDLVRKARRRDLPDDPPEPAHRAEESCSCSRRSRTTSARSWRPEARDQQGRLEEALARFRTSWSSADGGS